MLWRAALSISLASIIIGGESIKVDHQFPINQHDTHTQPSKGGNGVIRTMGGNAPPPVGEQIPQHERVLWEVQCSSMLTNHECGKTLDGKNTTFWQTKVDSRSTDPLPHSITIDLLEVIDVNAISMRPLPDADIGGAIARHKVYLSVDNTTWDLVAFGTWYEDVQDKYAIFESHPAQFIRLEATSATNGTEYIRVVNIGVWATDSPTPPSQGLGQWGPTVNFPLVPVGVFIDPIGGKVISFSSYAHNSFGQGPSDHTTFTSTWDPTTHTVSERHVRRTHHDMFCPGMSFDVHGRMIISGGETADKVSIYNPTTDDWINAKPMNIARGYQGSVTLANGHIFIVGGSWGPVGRYRGDRFGETYDPKADPQDGNWTKLEGIPSEPLETTEDWEKQYRADNHIWLMGWKNNSVFHPGPSKSMHWITPTGYGAIRNASQRGAHDTMCGAAAMYDAVEGKILAAGGAPSYNALDGNGNVMSGNGTADAFIITLGQVNASVEVKPAGQRMHYGRSFTHAVILPNGETLIVGGQEQPRVFTESSPQLTPEIYSPTKDLWTPVAPNSIVRAYHSFALLLRDATVLVGGGGLTIQLDVNHFDAQIYVPQYLLTAGGERATRPVIKKPTTAKVSPGSTFTIITDVEVVSASLVRYGGATHSLNNDQRRIPLDLQMTSNALEYQIVIPADGGVAIPGYYMLFVMDCHGVPSEASNVQIKIAKEYRGE